MVNSRHTTTSPYFIRRRTEGGRRPLKFPSYTRHHVQQTRAHDHVHDHVRSGEGASYINRYTTRPSWSRAGVHTIRRYVVRLSQRMTCHMLSYITMRHSLGTISTPQSILTRSRPTRALRRRQGRRLPTHAKSSNWASPPASATSFSECILTPPLSPNPPSPSPPKVSSSEGPHRSS